MKTNIFIVLILSVCVLSCRPDLCHVQFYLENSSPVEIKIDPINQENADFDTVEIISSNSDRLFQIGRDDTKYDSVPILMFIDSIYIIFDNQYAVMHYKDSTKGDYSHSIFNMDSYEQDGCNFTYTFTQEDYERAKAVKQRIDYCKSNKPAGVTNKHIDVLFKLYNEKF